MDFETYIGIDVQAAKDCPYAVIDANCRMLDSGWLRQGWLENDIRELVRRHSRSAIGIDAPRQALIAPRQWFWRSDRWLPKKKHQKGMGRHCEIILKASKVANPQWTPLESEAPEWMVNGFILFRALSIQPGVFEVFPSASYAALQGSSDVRVDISFSQFLGGPKDMIDAVVSALTVLEFVAGRGESVGGGDGLGEIILPRPVKIRNNEVLHWPGAKLVA